MAISFVGSATLNQTTSVTSFPVNVPAGTVNGDFMLAFVAHDAAGAAIARPAGWTALDANRSSAGHEWDVSYRAASSEPASYTWTSSAAGTAVAVILTYRGVHASPFNTSVFSTFTGTSQTWPNITTTVANCVLVAAVSSDNADADGAGTYAIPAGFTSRASFQTSTTRATIMACEKLKATAAVESGDAISYTTLNSGTGLCAGMIALAPAGAVITVPTAPLSLTATGGNSQVTLNWSVPSSDGGSTITDYKVYRGTTPGGETLLAPTGTFYPSNTLFPSDSAPGGLGTGTSYVDSTAVNGTTYYYKVSAVNGVGESPLSNEASATPSVGATAPTVPLSPVATPGNAQVALTWSAPASNGGSAITAYKIYRSLSTGAETLFASPAGTGTAYTDSTTANGILYFYKISAVNAIGESSLSSEVSATPSTLPSAPLGLGATPGNAQVGLSWSPPASDGGSAVTAYKVYRSTTAGAETLYASPVGTGTSYTDVAAANGTTYYYKVAAVNANGTSALSSESSATPSLPAPVSTRTYKRLYGPTLLSNAAATLYTVPASTTAVVRHVHVSNPTGAPVNFSLSIGTSAAGTRIWDAQPIPAGDVLDHYQDFTLAAGEIIQGFAGTTAVLNLTLDGYELFSP